MAETSKNTLQIETQEYPQNKLDKAIQLVSKACSSLKITTNTWCSAIIFIQKFYRYYHKIFKSDKEEFVKIQALDENIVAITCLHLSCKTNEEQRKLRDLINVGYKLLIPDKEYLPIGNLYYGIRETIIQAELLVLRALGLNTNVITPHMWATYMINDMSWWPDDGIPPEDTESVDPNLKELVRTVWMLLNDSVINPKFALDTHPQKLAAGCVYITIELLNISLPKNQTFQEWCKTWANSSPEEILGICKELDMYYQ